MIELKRMLHAPGYWRPSMAAFPDPPAPTNTPKMQELQRTDRARYDRIIADTRRAAAEYTRNYSQYDEETVAAVDKFRKDKGLDYQGDAPGLVDARLIDALRSASIAKKKAGESRPPRIQSVQCAASAGRTAATHSRPRVDSTPLDGQRGGAAGPFIASITASSDAASACRS